MQDGWIKLWRKLLDSPVFQTHDHYLICAFIYCLLKANHKSGEILFNKQMIYLNPGEFITGREIASEDLGFKGIMWDRKLKDLEILGILNRKMNNKFSIISIMNWDIYQGSLEENDQVNEQQMNNKRTTNEQQMNTNKNIKNVKNINISDEDFLQSLKEKFTWIDFDEVMVKMDAWILAHPQRKKTRRFIVNWLNKIEKPMALGQSEPTDPIDRTMWEINQWSKRSKNGHSEPP